MQPDTIICSRCGTVNTAGDQFCGSCGAFLEWEGREAASPPEPEPEPQTEPFPSDVTPVVATPTPTQTATPPPPTAPPDAAATAPPPQPQVGFTVCPHCGSGNPPGRTFCHKCGKLLSAPAPAASGSGSKTPATTKRSGGRGWLPIVIGAGLVVGLIAVVLAVVLKPAPLPTAVGPSATLTPTLAIPATITPPPASAGASPAASVVSSPVAPGNSVQLTLTGATSSSVAADTPDVAPGNVIDGRLDTRWEEKTGAAPGEWVEITFAASRLDYLVVYSGFQLSNDSFVATKRPQNVVVTINGGAPIGFMLADSETPQKLDVTDTPAATTVRIQIATTYPASQSAYPGSPIDAAAISEVRVFGSPGG